MCKSGDVWPNFSHIKLALNHFYALAETAEKFLQTREGGWGWLERCNNKMFYEFSKCKEFIILMKI